ncbi:MAG: two-component regulator propeller domain-containing protein [Flavobacteriales bacterium]
MSKLVAYIIFLFIVLQSVLAQDLRFNQLTNSDGLSQSVVNCILEDKYGFIWIGTQDGLNKYDGYSIEIMKTNPHDSLSLSGNNILCLYEDREGIIWIGTNDAGLNAFNRFTNKFTVYKHQPEVKTSLINNTVRSITEDENGVLWLGTEGGLCNLNKSRTAFKNYYPFEKGLQSNRVWSVAQSKNKNQLYVATFGEGLHIFNKKLQQFSQVKDTTRNGNLKVPGSEKVRTVIEDLDGNIWIGTNNSGLIKYQPTTNQFEYFVEGRGLKNISNERVRCITQMPDGLLWIGTFNGLNVFNPINQEFIKYHSNDVNTYSLNNNNITCILGSKNNIAWVGTDGGGVNIYKQLANRFKHYFKEENKLNTLSENTVMTVIKSVDNNLWIGTLGGGINILDRNNNNYKQITFPENKIHSRILALHQDNEGLIWIGSWGGGVNFYNPQNNQFSLPFEEGKIINGTSITNNTVVDIDEDKLGNIWFATLNGLNRYDKINKSIKNYFTGDGLVSNNITSLYSDKTNGVLYIGTNNGLCALNIEKNQFERIDLKKNQVTINTIEKIDQFNFWIGTNNGLVHLNIETKSVRWFYEVDGLPNEYIYGVLKDKKEMLWISTNFGLSKLDLNLYKKNQIAQFKNYFEIDGLQSNEFNQGSYYLAKDGEMFFGGINGFNSFYPDKVIDNPHQPPVYFTSFKIFEKEVELDSNISQKRYLELNYKDRFFSFEFVGIDFNLPSKNMFSWKLEGIDEDWTPPTKRRYVSYNNLPGGDYVLRVKASNNDGIWNEEGATIHITIIPPFWRTNWFYVTCTVLILVFIFGYIKFRERKLLSEKKLLAKKVTERTIELQEKNKDILSSITYAKRIQEAILPPVNDIKKYFPDSFIYYSPKDIVSGDFYWFGTRKDKCVLAVVDCTGHGVPGAFMSMIGHNLLHQIVVKEDVIKPSEILNKLDKAVVKALKQDDNFDTKDGMDMSLIVFDKKTNQLEYAGAYRPLYLFRNKELIKIDADKYPIGGGKQVQDNKTFSNHLVKIEQGDIIYMFTDGYPDQFGGDNELIRQIGGKKIMVKKFQEIIKKSLDLNLPNQHEALEKYFEDWKGNLEQVDDILIVGIKF